MEKLVTSFVSLEEFIMTKQFTRSFDYFRKQGLNPTQAAIMDQLSDRMESSIKRSKYYDKDEKSHLVIFTCEQMATKLNLSARSISRAYQSLEDNGWIKRKAIKGVTFAHIFLPNFTPNAFPYFINRHLSLPDKLSGTHWTICHLSQTLTIQTIKQPINTINTKTELQFKNSNQPPQPIQNRKTFESIPVIDLWKNATVTQLGFPVMAAEQIAKFTKNNVAEAKIIVKKILIARGAVVKENKLKKSTITQFESNGNIQSRLADTLTRIFSYIKRKNYSKYFGYLVRSCKDFFCEAFGLKLDVPIETPKIFSNKWKNKNVLKETLPNWAKEGYITPKADQITQAQNIQVNKKMAKLVLHKIILKNPNYLKSFNKNDLISIYGQLKSDLGGVKPPVLMQALKLVQTNLGKTVLKSGDTLSNSQHPNICETV